MRAKVLPPPLGRAAHGLWRLQIHQISRQGRDASLRSRAHSCRCFCLGEIVCAAGVAPRARTSRRTASRFFALRTAQCALFCAHCALFSFALRTDFFAMTPIFALRKSHCAPCLRTAPAQCEGPLRTAPAPCEGGSRTEQSGKSHCSAAVRKSHGAVREVFSQCAGAVRFVGLVCYVGLVGGTFLVEPSPTLTTRLMFYLIIIDTLTTRLKLTHLLYNLRVRINLASQRSQGRYSRCG